MLGERIFGGSGLMRRVGRRGERMRRAVGGWLGQHRVRSVGFPVGEHSLFPSFRMRSSGGS